VAQGLAAIRGNEWVAGIAQGLNVVKVSVADVRVEPRGQADGFHEVAGEGGRFATRGERSAQDSVDFGDAGSSMKVPAQSSIQTI
jgi:hypothetical protein